MNRTKFTINPNTKRSDWDPTLNRLATFLDNLQALNVSDSQLKSVIDTLMPQQNDKGFWGFVKPHDAPSDARVDYYFKPTYLVTAIMMHAWLKQPAVVTEQKSFMMALSKAMEACAARAFSGHGYDEASCMLDTLMIFAKGSAADLLDIHPVPNIKFADLIKKSLSNVQTALVTGNTWGAWGEDYAAKYLCVWKANYPKADVTNFLIHKVFVYGTLMKGKANHAAFMNGARFEGAATLPDYALYDLGSYPAILPESGDLVRGEVYSVSGNTLKNLHHLEGEGRLYNYKNVLVDYEDKDRETVGTYVFCGEIDPDRHVPSRCQPWHRGWQRDLIWYASYGSNLLEERFLHYLQGGVCRFNNITYNACNDAAPPMKSLPIRLPHPMYFGNNSRSWNNGGVSFLDTSRTGDTLGRMYLITNEQMEHIRGQEGRGEDWYDCRFELGSRNDIPIITITNHGMSEMNPPSENYLKVVRLGLQETYPEMTLQEIDEYLRC